MGGVGLHSSNFEPLMFALGQKADIRAGSRDVRFTPKADIGSAGRDVRFVPKADIHGLFDHLDTPNGNQRSISPNTMSREPSIAGTSASMCPRVKKSIAAKCGNDGARILHLYGWLVPSETR